MQFGFGFNAETQRRRDAEDAEAAREEVTRTVHGFRPEVPPPRALRLCVSAFRDEPQLNRSGWEGVWDVVIF